MAVNFLDEVPSYEVREGIMYVTAGEFALAMPLRKFRLGMAKAERAIAEYDSRRAEVVPMRRKGRAKH